MGAAFPAGTSPRGCREAAARSSGCRKAAGCYRGSAGDGQRLAQHRDGRFIEAGKRHVPVDIPGQRPTGARQEETQGLQPWLCPEALAPAYLLGEIKAIWVNTYQRAQRLKNNLRGSLRRLKRKRWRLCLKPEEMLSPAPEKTSDGKKHKLFACSEAALAG